jgi:hypothetical protein
MTDQDDTALPWGTPTPPDPRRPARRGLGRLVFLVVATLVVVVVGGWFYDYQAREAAVERAHTAFQQGDCDTVIDAAADADRGTVGWGGSAEPPPGGAVEIDQCRELSTLSAEWEAGHYALAADGYSDFADDYGHSEALVPLVALVQKAATSPALLSQVPEAGACSAMETLSTTSAALAKTFDAFREMRPLLPGPVPKVTYDPAVLVSCAGVFEKQKQLEKASTFYTAALVRKPSKALITKATQGKVRAEIQLAKDAGAQRLPAPTKVSGTGSGPAVVLIRNVSPDPLDVIMSGVKPVVTTIKACKGCEKYLGVGPFSCPEKGVEKTFQVPAGTYAVTVRSVSDEKRRVTPVLGSWKLTKGSRYESCVYIAQLLK